MRKLGAAVFALILFLCGQTPSAYAAHYYLGGLGGYSLPLQQGTPFLAYGADFGFFVGMNPMVGLGVHTLKETRTESGTVGADLTSYTGEVMVMPGMLTLGLRAGQMKSGLGNDFLLGGFGEYDFGLSSHFTLGLQGSYETVSASTRFNLVNVLGVLKVWF